MGLLDDWLGSALGGGLGQPGGERPTQSSAAAGSGAANVMMALLPVVLSMLANRRSGPQPGGGGLGDIPEAGARWRYAVGTGGRLGDPLQQMQCAGSGEHARSWVGTGQNTSIAPNAMGQVFGESGLCEIARHASAASTTSESGWAVIECASPALFGEDFLKDRERPASGVRAPVAAMLGSSETSG